MVDSVWLCVCMCVRGVPTRAEREMGVASLLAEGTLEKVSDE